MDRIRRLGRSKSSGNKIGGSQHIHEEKNIPKLVSPNVVARLMGLDGLPSQQPIRGQQKRLADNNIQRTAPIVSQRDVHLCEGLPHKKSYVEQPEFKDVFDDTVEKSASNEDLMLELLQQPNSLFVKHLCGVQADPSNSMCNHIAVLKSSNPAKHEPKAKRWKAEEESSKKHDIGSKEIHEDDILRHFYSSHGSQNSLKSSKVRTDGKDESDIVSRRIVILKPNYVTTWDAFNSFSSPDSSHVNLSDCWNYKEYTSTWTKEENYFGKMDFSNDVGLSRLYFFSNGSRSEKLNAEHEAHIDDKLLISKEALGRSKAVNGNSNGKEDFSSNNSRPGKKQSPSSCHRYACNTNSLLESHPNQDHMDINLEKKDPSEQQRVVPQTPNSVDRIVDAAANTEHEYIITSPVSSNELTLELSTCMLNYGDSNAGDQEDSNRQESSVGPSERGSMVQCTGAEPESSERFKEADYPSPVSVLEVPSREDDGSSDPESFEQVSSDLQELQKQLQLLKRESKAYAEAPTLLKSDNDVRLGLIIPVEEKEIVRSQCCESSYIVDVLIELGFKDTDPDMFMTTWYSPDCPLGPWVFDNLENKYYDDITGLKNESRLLFDRINSALLEISKSFMDLSLWVRPATLGFGLKWQKCEVRDELCKLLAIQENEASGDTSGKLLDKEMHWLDSRDSIDVIGMEIEKLLINDLITELVTM